MTDQEQDAVKQTIKHVMAERGSLKLDAERYQKLRQWMIVDAKLYSQSDTPGKARVILYGPTFDAAVDALPEPKETAESGGRSAMSEKQKDEQPSITYHTFHCRCGWRPDPMSSPDEARALGEKHVESCEQWKADARKILERECSEEQKIGGVPDGWLLVGIRSPRAREWFIGPYGSPRQAVGDHPDVKAVIERIPKPKKRVLICEFDVTGIEGGLGTAIQSSRNMQSMSARIEERDV